MNTMFLQWNPEQQDSKSTLTSQGPSESCIESLEPTKGSWLNQSWAVGGQVKKGLGEKVSQMGEQAERCQEGNQAKECLYQALVVRKKMASLAAHSSPLGLNFRVEDTVGNCSLQV